MVSNAIKPSKVFFTSIILSFYLPIGIWAQDMSAMSSDPRAPVYRSIVNPGFLLHGKKCLEFSLAGAGINLGNNMFFIERGLVNVSAFFNDPVTYLEQMYHELQFFENTSIARLSSLSRIQGPSLIFNPNNKVSFSLSSAFRVAGEANGVPSHLAYLMYQGIPNFSFREQLLDHQRAFGGSTMSWSEIGVGVAVDFTKEQDVSQQRITAGLTLHSLFGYHGAHVRESAFEYLVNDGFDIVVNDMNLTVMSASPFDIYEWEFTNPGFRGLGRGFSVSAGVVLEKYKDDKKLTILGKSRLGAPKDYRYRLGVSLTDIGAIRFDRRANRVELEDASFTLYNPRFSDYSSFAHLLSTIQDSLRSGYVRTLVGEPFRLGLPSAVNIQFDYNFGENFHAHFFVVQDLPLMTNRVARKSQVGIVPRFDTGFLSVALPITFNHFYKPRFGAYIRVAFLSIGTDAPGGLLGVNDFSGMDFYFSFNFGVNCPKKKRIGRCGDVMMW